VKESKDFWIAYNEYVKKNGHYFKQRKAESKLSHKIEKSRAKINEVVAQIIKEHNFRD
jgi:hypothetical protein